MPSFRVYKSSKVLFFGIYISSTSSSLSSIFFVFDYLPILIKKISPAESVIKALFCSIATIFSIWYLKVSSWGNYLRRWLLFSASKFNVTSISDCWLYATRSRALCFVKTDVKWKRSGEISFGNWYLSTSLKDVSSSLTDMMALNFIREFLARITKRSWEGS